MGKWSKFKNTLVRFAQPEAWQSKVDKRKQHFSQMSKVELCKQFTLVKDEKDRLNDELSVANIDEEALHQILVELLESEGDTQIKNEFGTFFIRDEPYCSVQDRRAYLDWVRESKMEDILTVNYQTTSGLVKKKLEDGEDVPPGITVFLKSSIGFRKATE